MHRVVAYRALCEEEGVCSHDLLMPSVHATVNIMPPVLQVLGLAVTAEQCIFREGEQWHL